MRPSYRLVVTLVLWLSCALAAVAGCGGSDSGVASNSGGGGGAAATDGGGAGGGTGGGIDVDGSSQTLTVDPPTATLTVTSATTAVTQQLTALSNGSAVPATWTLDTFDIVTIDSSGLATTTGILAGKTVVTATYGGKTATAELLVKVDLSEDVDPSVDPLDHSALAGTPGADPGPQASTLLYPYDETVMPKGLIAPLVMFSAGSLPPTSAKLTLQGDNFSWQGYYTVAAPNTPRLTIPQNIWDAALYSSQGKKLALKVAKAAGGAAFGPYAVNIGVAPGSLRGVVYYQTYEDPQTGIWAVRPGEQQPANQVKAGCVVCHSVSANGKYLAAGADSATYLAESGVYAVDQSGQATQITGAPSNLGRRQPRHRVRHVHSRRAVRDAEREQLLGRREPAGLEDRRTGKEAGPGHGRGAGRRRERVDSGILARWQTLRLHQWRRRERPAGHAPPLHQRHGREHRSQCGRRRNPHLQQSARCRSTTAPAARSPSS